MSTYISIFIFELITAYILWFILKNLLYTNKFFRILIVCLITSFVIGFVASYRIIGYEVTIDYLTEINDQNIKKTGQEITLEEESKYKEELFQTKEFKDYLLNNAIKISLIPFIFTVFTMLFIVEKTTKRNRNK